MHSVTGNHQLLVGGDDSNLDLGIREGNHHFVRLFTCVPVVVELDSELCEILADAAAESRIVFSDTACKDNQVHSVHRSSVGTYEFGEVISELL